MVSYLGGGLDRAVVELESTISGLDGDPERRDEPDAADGAERARLA